MRHLGSDLQAPEAKREGNCLDRFDNDDYRNPVSNTTI